MSWEKISSLVMLTVCLGLCMCGQKNSEKASDPKLLLISSMHERRASHSATLLPDGRVLIAGGFKKGPDGSSQIYSATTEFYIDSLQGFVHGPEMHLGRAGHTATLLNDGKVLIAGGFTASGMTASAEIFDPKSNKFTEIGPMIIPRGDFTATLLSNGNVLIAGGGDVDGTANAEIYNPIEHSFRKTGSMNFPRIEQTAVRLPDGKVLIIGGGNGRKVYSSAEIYDPSTQKFTMTGSMSYPRYKQASIVKPDGNVLVLGGSDERDWHGTYASIEEYDTKTNYFKPCITMNFKRFKFPGCVIQNTDSTIMICGGNKQIECINLNTGISATIGSLDQSYYYSTATLLPDKSILIAGGYNDKPQSTDKAWVYK